jgi:hypothetical protein
MRARPEIRSALGTKMIHTEASRMAELMAMVIGMNGDDAANTHPKDIA